MYCRIRVIPDNSVILHVSGHHYRYNSFFEAEAAIESILEQRPDMNKSQFAIEEWNEKDSMDSFQIHMLRSMIREAIKYANQCVN